MISAFITRMSKREKIFFYSTVFLILLFLFDRLVFNPIASKSKRLDAEINTQEAIIKKNLRILSQKDWIEKEEKRYSSYLEKRKLSPEEEMAALLEEIEGIAKEFSLQLVDINPGKVETTGITEEYVIELDCEAKIEEVIRFMHSIEYSKKRLRIKEFDITPISEGSDTVKCSMTISRVVIL